MHLINVDLPAPFSPINATISPLSISIDVGCNSNFLYFLLILSPLIMSLFPYISVLFVCNWIECNINLVLSYNQTVYYFYISSLTIISAKPSRFCPLHFSISSLLGSVIDNPIPHMQSLTAHSAKTASPVAFNLAFNSGF